MPNFPAGLFDDPQAGQRDPSTGWLRSPWSGAQSQSFRPSATSTAYNLPTYTAQSNLAASPYNVQLADLVNATNRAAQQAANVSRLGPEGAAVQKTLLGNIGQEAKGLLDPETEQMLRAGIAARGGAQGMGVDSANLASAYRRALGETITGTERQAEQEYLQLLAQNPAAPIYSPSNLLMTPGQYASVANAETAATQPRIGSAPRVSFPGGGGGGGYVPSAAEANTVPYGGGYPGAGMWTGVNAADLGLENIGTAALPENTALNPVTQTTYNTYGLPADWRDWMQGYGGSDTSTGTTGNLAGLGLAEWYNTEGT